MQNLECTKKRHLAQDKKWEERELKEGKKKGEERGGGRHTRLQNYKIEKVQKINDTLHRTKKWGRKEKGWERGEEEK